MSRKEWMQRLRTALDGAKGDPTKQARLIGLLAQEQMEADYDDRRIPEADKVVLIFEARCREIMDARKDSEDSSI